MKENKTETKEIQIAFPEHLRSGVYCNNMVVSHTKEEFIMDFMMIAPPASTVTARVIMSPGHMKRTVAALKSNLERYEQKIGAISEAPEPTDKGSIGFHKA
jgi:hypothetical protein